MKTILFTLPYLLPSQITRPRDVPLARGCCFKFTQAKGVKPGEKKQGGKIIETAKCGGGGREDKKIQLEYLNKKKWV